MEQKINYELHLLLVSSLINLAMIRPLIQSIKAVCNQKEPYHYMTKVSCTLFVLRCTWFEDLHKAEKPIPSLIESSYLHSLISTSLQTKMHIVREMLKINLRSHNYDIHSLVGPLNSIFSLGEFLNSTMGNFIRQETISVSYPKCPAAI